jgi:hypothetical protein
MTVSLRGLQSSEDFTLLMPRKIKQRAPKAPAVLLSSDYFLLMLLDSLDHLVLLTSFKA